MSKLKKMKLIPHSENETPTSSQRLLSALDISTSPYLKSAADLDFSIKNILESDLDEYQKAKLYSRELKNFLIHKYRYQNPELKIENIHEKDSIPPSQSSSLFKTPVIKKKRKPSSIKTPKITNSSISLNKPSVSTNLFNIGTSNRPSRLVKSKARQNLKSYFDEESDISDDDSDQSSNWVPYRAPKALKTVKRIKSRTKK